MAAYRAIVVKNDAALVEVGVPSPDRRSCAAQLNR
jgi:hypothetical protein